MRAGERDSLEAQISACLERADLHGAATIAVSGYGPHLLRYLRSVLQDDELAHEAFSELAEKIWVGLDRFRRDSSFRTWAYALAWNVAQDSRRDRYRQRRRGLSEITDLVQAVRESTASDIGTTMGKKFERLKATLTLEERSLLVLRFDKKLRWREIAEAMSEQGKSLDVDAVKKRYQRLRQRLRNLASSMALEREEVTPA